MENAFDLALKILAPAMDFCPIGPDDYEKDGIIHCAMCHTPRQMWLDVLGERRLVRIMCRCKGEELDRINQEEKARKQMEQLTALGFGNMPICMAKTQYSFSDNPALLGAPKGFTVTVRNLKVSAGAGFIVALTGDIMTMPGLPKVPAAEKIDVDENGKISGLF